MSNVTETRKLTKFHVCAAHSGWFAGLGQRRIVEVFVEGGPASAGPCEPSDPCRLWPGRDWFYESICHGEFVLDWGQS